MDEAFDAQKIVNLSTLDVICGKKKKIYKCLHIKADKQKL